MLSLHEIKLMLTRFEEADSNGELEAEGAGALKALRWVTEDHDYSEMDDMLPEEEVCPDCNDSECGGASGGVCDEDVEEVEVVEPNPEDFQIDLKMQRE